MTRIFHAVMWVAGKGSKRGFGVGQEVMTPQSWRLVYRKEFLYKDVLGLTLSRGDFFVHKSFKKMYLRGVRSNLGEENAKSYVRCLS